MANNKVQLSDGTVLLDLTGDTVTPETLMAGVIAHNAAGERIVGICVAKEFNVDGPWSSSLMSPPARCSRRARRSSSRRLRSTSTRSPSKEEHMANTNYIDSFEVNGVEIPVRDPGFRVGA